MHIIVLHKAIIRTLSRVAAGEYAKDNVRVNAIFPGFILTDLTKEVVEGKEVFKLIQAKIPLPLLIEVQDVAFLVLCLASDHD